MILHAGAAVREISPEKPMVLCGYPHVERISEGKHDPLLASVLFLNQGNRGLLLAALDLLFIDPPTARQWRRCLAEEMGMRESDIFISCTHTHSGPVTVDRHLAWKDDPAAAPVDTDFLVMVESRLQAAARAAKAAAEPARLAWTSARITGVGTNRHDPTGTTDPECGILSVRRRSTGEMLSMSLIYGMHPTVLHEDSKLISSDFPHYVRQYLREQYGEQLTVCYHNAPCGNQSPRHVVEGQTFAEAERLGRLLGEQVQTAVQALTEADYQDGEEDEKQFLNSALEKVELPRRALPDLPEARAAMDEYRRKYQALIEQGASRADVRTAECAVFGAEKMVGLARAWDSGELDRLMREYPPFEAQVVRIGDHCMAGVPGELFTEYALRIKQNSPATYPVAFVNGELQGYIVTPEAAAAGGYEAAGSIFAPEAGDRLVEAALRAVKRV